MRKWHRSSADGATLVEFAFILPLLIALIVGIIVFGIGVFYQQQIDNAARVAARYASTHSSTAQCPTSSWLPLAAPADNPLYDALCDSPDIGWPRMTAAARDASFGLARNRLEVSACWSGYWRINPDGSKVSTIAYDAQPPILTPPESAYFRCRLGGKDPVLATSSLACPEPSVITDDEGSDIAGNSVTVYVCYAWTPPMAGFLGLPTTVTFRSVATEVIHRQR